MDISSLISGIGGSGITIFWFVVALSIIVAIHEYGHYIVGRWSGIGADVFSIGFGPVIYSRYDKRGTKWQIAAIPLGGYVKFKGDANAASGKDGDAMSEMSEEERRQTMHGAPLWARTATVAAGPVFNFMLSILLYGVLIGYNGQVGERFIIGKIWDLPAAPFELQEGDVVTGINGTDMPGFDDAEGFEALSSSLPHSAVLEYAVERDGEALTVSGPYLQPPLIHTVVPRSAANRAGLQVGDVITAVDGVPIVAFSQLQAAVIAAEGRPLSLTADRTGDVLDVTLTPKRVDEPKAGGGFETHYRIGISGGFGFDLATEPMPIWASLKAGVMQTWGVITTSISALYHIITGGISTCNLSGPVGIAQTTSAMAEQGVVKFLWTIAGISTAIGMLNLFPIPMLDGGHLVFYAYEAVRGRPPADNVLQVLMTIGLILVLSLMIFGLSNDFLCP